MWHWLKNCFRRPPLRFGLGQDRRSRFRNPCFASFIAHNDPRVRSSDSHDALLRGRRLVRRALLLLVGLGGAWIVIESAKALATF